MEIAPRLEGRRERVKQFVTNRVFGGMSRCIQWTSFFQHFNGSGPCICIGPQALDPLKFFEIGMLSQKFQWTQTSGGAGRVSGNVFVWGLVERVRDSGMRLV